MELDLLEQLLALTEYHLTDTNDWRQWQKISAIVADLREQQEQKGE